MLIPPLIISHITSATLEMIFVYDSIRTIDFIKKQVLSVDFVDSSIPILNMESLLTLF